MKKIVYKGADETVFYEKLPNGLEVFMYPNQKARNFYLAFNVKFGSMDTEFKCDKEKKFTSVPNGTAHFLEHQMFQEDDGVTAFEYFGQLGSSVNAFTTYGYTSYEVTSCSFFKENLEYLLDYVQNPVFKPGSVNKERGIIREEIKMYDNTPMSVLNFGLEYNLNKQDKHKFLISGTEDDIKEITADTLDRCYQVFYHPSNMFLVLTGNFSPLEALGIIKTNQAGKLFSPRKKITKKALHEPIEVDSPYEEREMDVSVPKLKVAYKISKDKFKNIDDVKLKIYLDAILQIKFGISSDLLEKLIDEKLIPWDLYPAREVRNDYVMISLEMETEYKEEVLDLIRSELKNIKISREELERIKKGNIANFFMHFNDIMEVAQDIEDDVLANGKIEENILEYYKNLELKEINMVASAIDIKNESVFYISKIAV